MSMDMFGTIMDWEVIRDEQMMITIAERAFALFRQQNRSAGYDQAIAFFDSKLELDAFLQQHGNDECEFTPLVSWARHLSGLLPLPMPNVAVDVVDEFNIRVTCGDVSVRLPCTEQISTRER